MREKKHKLVACYLPTNLGKHEEDIRRYIENLEDELALKRRNKGLIIRRDFNAQAQSRELRVETKPIESFK